MTATAGNLGRESAFSNDILQFLFDLSEIVIRPYLYCLTGLGSPFLPITPELRNPGLLRFRKIVITPLYCVGLTICVIPALCAFCVRNVLHHHRRPYCLSLRSSPKALDISSSNSAFTVATTNLCLMPEVMSRYNNLSRSLQRAQQIGERIVIDQMHYTGMMEKFQEQSTNFQKSGYAALHSPDVKFDILGHFPYVDFLCIQEAFDRDYTKKLISEIHKVYPFVVYDVGYSGPKRNLCGINSGLMVASRYKILDVRFRPFSRKCGWCRITGKGLLMLKVCLGTSKEGRKVGYIFNTHLQAFQGNNPIVEVQLSEVEMWTTEFRKDTHEAGDEVMLDVLAGDFNIDNMSPGELHLTEHSLFNMYIDVCRLKPGTDHDWTVGTEMRNPFLYDDAISTPEGLKTVLEDPYLRQRYIIDADVKTATMDSLYNAEVKVDKHGNTVLSPVGGRRRIDFVLYRKDCPLVAEHYNLVTRLAGLTDHVPVSMTFRCCL